MNSKTKFTLSVLVMVLVAAVALISIVAVFASRTQNFSSNIVVKYTASQITGKVSAKYYIGPTDTTGTAMTSNGKADGDTELVFNSSDSQSSSSTLNPQGNIILEMEDTYSNTPDRSWVVFEYVFQNGLGSRIDTDYLATMSFDGEATNIKIFTAESDEKLTDFSQIKTEISSPKSFSSQVLVEHKQESNYISYKYFYVKAEIYMAIKNAKFSGNFSWDLAYHNPADPLPTLDKLVFYEMSGGYGVAPSANAVGDIVIPETYKGNKVVAIENGDDQYSGVFTDCSEITSVHFPAGIYIGDYAFSGCYNLTNVTFSGPVQIGKGAFYELTEITEVNIPGGEIGEGAFACCANLTNVTFGGPVIIGAQAFISTGITEINISDGEIGESAFSFCTELKTIIIDGNVSMVPSAFGGYYSIENIFFTANVQQLSPNGFENMFVDAQFTITIEGEALCNWQAIGAAFVGCFNSSTYHITIKTKYEMQGEYDGSSGSFDRGSLRNYFSKNVNQIDGYWVYDSTWY